jgi:lysozyme
MSIFSLPAPSARQKTGWAAAAILTVTMCASFEGYAKHPYVDYVGRGHPITWCFGETKTDGPIPKMTATFTREQCDELLKKSLVKYNIEINKYIHVVMGAQTEAAMTDAAYNLGSGIFKRGSMTRYLNAGGDFNDVVGASQSVAYRRYHPLACHALRAYNHGTVHGRSTVLPGLTRRRAAEEALCNQDN